jgi:hypothetical protein
MLLYSYVANDPMNMADPTGLAGGSNWHDEQVMAGGRAIGAEVARSPTKVDDAMLVGMVGLLAAPALWEVYLAVIANPVTATNVVVGVAEMTAGEALGTSTLLAGAGVLATRADDAAEAVGTIFRTGSQTDNALTAKNGGVSFRDSISSSADGRQKFEAGQNIFAVDVQKLPPGTVRFDGGTGPNLPHGHVSVFATPKEIRDAVIPKSADNPLGELGLKEAQNPGTYKLPK